MSSDGPKRRYVSAKRAAASEANDARIVEAAFVVLQRVAEGGEPFSLEAVAKEAGVTRLTVHNRFGSRRGLLEAVFDSRAAEAGLQRVAQAMAQPDAEAAILMVISIFCDFWASDHRGLGGLVVTGAADPEFVEAMRARNERRRHIFGVLAGRLVEKGRLAPEKRTDLVDILFALSSMPFYATLASGERSAEAAKALVSGLAQAAIAGGQVH
ncbi:TetR family transcriptional regulator [Devosia sp. D6-9]|nr:TetR family transcriptional regulator [Devosia sp. D6-9]